jgi:BASS family bile acid:Na+ symporter
LLEADGTVSDALFTAGVAVAIVATVLSLGMAFPAAVLLAPLRQVRLVAVMLTLNTVVVPAAAWVVAKIAPITDGYVAGIALAATGSGGAAGLKAAQLSRRADLPLAVGLVVVLQVANLVAVPLWAAVMVTGASLNRLTILQSMLVLVLLPLLVGGIVRARSAALAARMRPVLLRVGNLALAAALAAGVAANRDVLLSVLDSAVVPAALAITGLALGLGSLVGIADRPTRITTSLITGTRFSALGLIIASTQFAGRPEYLAAAITFSLVDLVVMIVASVAVRPGLPRRRSAPEAT